MSDHLDILKQIVSDGEPTERGSGHYGNITGREAGAILDAITELQRLRAEHDYFFALAGKVSIGPSYADIAKDARHDLPVSDACDNG